MPDGLFAPWHIVILVVVLVLLFGARRLPTAAKSLGSSMRIFKNEVQGIASDSKEIAGSPLLEATALPAPPVVDTAQLQLANLQRQVAELQRQSAGSGIEHSAVNFNEALQLDLVVR